MNKRMLAIFLAILMVLSIIPAASAAEVTASGTCGDSATWTLTDDGTLTISGTGEISAGDWNQYQNEILKVVIEDGITAIGESALASNSKLTEVIIPSSVTDIGEGAFGWCYSLTEISVDRANKNYKTVDGVLFTKDGTKLIMYPAERYGVYEIPDGVTAIGNYAFSAAGTLHTVTIPDGVTSIGDYAFFECIGLSSMVIPDSVTEIGDFAFYNCFSIEDLSVPDSLSNLGTGAFYGCTNAADDDGFVIVNGVLFDYAYTFLEKSDVVVPEGVTKIDYYAFGGADNLVTVTLPDTVTSIGEKAFYYCSDLTSVTGSDSLISIGDYAFEFCKNLTEVEIPYGVTYIGINAFSNCESLTEVTIPDSVTDIGECAFRYCKNLTNAAISKGITEIPDHMFYHCEKLMDVTIPKGVTDIGEWAFSNCKSLTEVTIPKGVTDIGDFAFSSCENLTDVVFEGDAPNFDGAPFSGATQSTGYYPENNDTWTWEVWENYSGITTWVPYTPEVEINFTDVPTNSYYIDAVKWAVANGITNGMGNGTFAPDDTCTRNQVVTFLWRAEGSPEPESTDNPFVDVKETDYFYKAVLWAVENGVTTGMDKTHFNPNGECTRAQVVTFLHRAAQKPAPASTKNPFSDVKQDFYTDAVLWAVGEGITTGITATTFAPESTCTRAQIVTFLSRAYQ